MRSRPIGLALLAPLAVAALFACNAASGGSSDGAWSNSTAGNDAGSSGASASNGDGGVGASEDSGPGNVSDDGGDAGASPLPPQSCPPSWTTTPTCGGGTSTDGGAPNFGPNVLIFDPSMSMTSIQSQIAQVYAQQDSAQFGTGRYAFFFLPGQYSLDVQVGFYTQLLGLGQSPDDVVITGAVRAKADWLGNNNATCNFWRAAENFAVVPTQAIDSDIDVWAVAQGTALRRAHVMGTISLDDNGGWASGGFIADSKIDAQISSGAQQQFLTRNVDLTDWQGSNWNMVFVGDGQPPSGTWPSPPYTTVSTTPIVREKPFLYVDASGDVLRDGPGAEDEQPGVELGVERRLRRERGVDRPVLHRAAGRRHGSQPQRGARERASTSSSPPASITSTASSRSRARARSSSGIGLPTLIPDDGNAVLAVGDVDGVTIAGLLLEAGPTSSPDSAPGGDRGERGRPLARRRRRSSTSTAGSAEPMSGTAANCVTINSNDVIVDNTWLWRADHGAGAGWTVQHEQQRPRRERRRTSPSTASSSSTSSSTRRSGTATAAPSTSTSRRCRTTRRTRARGRRRRGWTGTLRTRSPTA